MPGKNRVTVFATFLKLSLLSPRDIYNNIDKKEMKNTFSYFYLILIVLVGVSLAVTSCQMLVDDDGGTGGDPNDDRPLYDGYISEFSLDIDEDGMDDLTTSPEPRSVGESTYQLHYFVSNDNLNLLAHQRVRVTGEEELDVRVVELLARGDKIERGFEEVLYPVDYYYGPKYLAIGAQVNSDATIPMYFDGPIAGKQGYLAFYMNEPDGRHFGWIEVECDSYPELVLQDMMKPTMTLLDTKFKVTDVYLCPKAELFLRAGSKPQGLQRS